MPTYSIELKPQAQRQLDKIKGRDYHLIVEAIERLKEEPRPGSVEKLQEAIPHRLED